MPGIVGLITKMPRTQAEQELLRMVQAIQHESFYVTGTFVDESSGVYVGWVAQKNSFSEIMPLQNETGDIVLTFAGEEYPDGGAIQKLKMRGHSFDENGASYLVHVAEEDKNFPAKLNGRFQGLLVSRSQGTSMLFNDRYGMHRVYYHESKNAFYFAVEAKAILAVLPELRKIDERGLGELVACGCVLGDRTLFEGIHLLPGGSMWVFRHGLIEKKNNYFQPREWEQQAPMEAEPYYQELKDKFTENLPRYFDGKLPIGVALTGGLDTRIIMAWRKAAPKSFPCYTFGGAYRDCQDVVVGRNVASVCGQSHQVIPVGLEFLSRFPHYAERSLFLTDVGVDVSRSPDLFVSEKAREIAQVKIVGTYGSEVIRHVRAFKPVDPVAGLFRPELLSYVKQARETYDGLVRENPVTFVAFRQSPWYHYGVLSLEQTQLVVRSPYLDNDIVKTVYCAPRDSSGGADVRLRLIVEGNQQLGRIPSDRGIRATGTGPFTYLNRGFQEFTFKAEYAYDYGMPQWVAKIDHAFASFHLERLFLGRHKFAHFRVWYRNALSSYVRQMLLDSRTLSRPYLDRRGVESVVNGHLRGDRNYTIEIHRLLTLELLHRLFAD